MQDVSVKIRIVSICETVFGKQTTIPFVVCLVLFFVFLKFANIIAIKGGRKTANKIIFITHFPL